MDAVFEGQWGARLRLALFAAVVLLGVFLAIQALAGLIGLRFIGTGVAATNTISVAGQGEALAVPDIATFNFSVVSEKGTVAAAQADATAKINAIIGYLKEAGIDEKDIRTADYSVYPKYEWRTSVCPAGSTYCPGGQQVLTGYEVRQTTAIKVRDTAKAGDLLTGVGGRGATEVSGLTFTFDDPDAVELEARGKAIADAKQKAQELADSLGVSLVRVVSFSESTNGGEPPVVYGRGGADMVSQAKTAPEISLGQNKVTSNVSVVYEIR